VGQLSSAEAHRKGERTDGEHDIVLATWLPSRGTTEQFVDGYTAIMARTLERIDRLNEARRPSALLPSSTPSMLEEPLVADSNSDSPSNTETEEPASQFENMSAASCSDSESPSSDVDMPDANLDDRDLAADKTRFFSPDKRSPSPAPAAVSRSRSASPVRILRLRSANSTSARRTADTYRAVIDGRRSVGRHTVNTQDIISRAPTQVLSQIPAVLSVTEAAGVLLGLLRSARLDPTNYDYSDPLVFIHQPLTNNLMIKHSSTLIRALGVRAPGEIRNQRIVASRNYHPRSVYLEQNCEAKGCVRYAALDCEWNLCFSHCVRHGGLSVACECLDHTPLKERGVLNFAVKCFHQLIFFLRFHSRCPCLVCQHGEYSLCALIEARR